MKKLLIAFLSAGLISGAADLGAAPKDPVNAKSSCEGTCWWRCSRADGTRNKKCYGRCVREHCGRRAAVSDILSGGL